MKNQYQKLEKIEKQYRSIEKDYLTVLSSLERMKDNGEDISAYQQGLYELEQKFVKARLLYNLHKDEIREAENSRNLETKVKSIEKTAA